MKRRENPNASTILMKQTGHPGQTKELKTGTTGQDSKQKRPTKITEVHRFKYTGKQAKQDNKGVGLIRNTWRD